MGKPVQASYEDKGGKKKITVTVDTDAAMKEARIFVGKAVDTMGRLATAGVKKAREFADKVPTMDLKIEKTPKTATPKTRQEQKPKKTASVKEDSKSKSE